MVCSAANACYYISTQTTTLLSLGISTSFLWHAVLILPDDAKKVDWREANRFARTLRLVLIGVAFDHLFPRANSSI